MASSEERKRRTRGGGNDDDIIVIKKYANRRLYNTATSSYVTLDHLCQMVKDDVDFVVYDAKTGEDITRPVLTQIIVEEESKGANLLPINFLRQLIGFYGDSMQFMVPKYLEQMMGSFAQNQERLRQSMQETMGNMFPFGNLEEMGRQNVAMMEKAMQMFSPFPGEGGRDKTEPTSQARATAAESEGKAPEAVQAGIEAQIRTLEQLQNQVETLRKELADLNAEKEKRSPEAGKTQGAQKAGGGKRASKGGAKN